MSRPPIPTDDLLEHAGFVRGLARSLLKDAAAADDAVQETWLAATRSPPAQAGKERSWLSKVVRNAVRQQRRSAGRRSRHEQAAARPEVRPGTARPTDELAARDEIFRNVTQAVMSLPEMYRAVVMLRFYEGLPPRKIAAKLDLPVETVRTRLKRALAMLRDGLDDSYGGDRRAWVAALAPFAGTPLVLGGAAAVGVKALAAAAVVGVGLIAWRALDSTHDEPSEPPAIVEAGGGTTEPRDRPVDGPVLFGRVPTPDGPGSVTGRVLNMQTGERIADARLEFAVEDGAPAWQRSATTRADGTFRLHEVPSGRPVLLRVDAQGLKSRRLPAFVVQAGRVADLGTIWIGAPGRLSGHVVDARGQGIGGADVEVHSAAYPFARFPPPPELLLVGLDEPLVPLAATYTDADGAFVLDEVPPGPVTLITRAAGFRQSARRVVMTADGHAGDALEVRLAETAPVYGRVVDGTGDGIGGARVGLVPRLETPGDFYARIVTVTDAAGRFRFDAPPPTDGMRVVAAASGHPTWLERVTGTVRSLRLVLERGATLEMRLVDATTDAPLVRAHLTMTLGESLDRRLQGAYVVQATTDDRGIVTLDLTPGTLHLLVVAHEAFGIAAFSPVARGRPSPLDLGDASDGRVAAGANVWTIRCAPGTTVRGSVTNPEGEPIEGARCRVMGMGGESLITFTDPRGRYLTRVGMRGPSLLQVEAAGFVQPQSTMMVMPAGGADAQVHDVRLEMAARVVGRVLDTAGRPLTGVETSLVDAAPSRFAPPGPPVSSVTNADGGFAFDGVRPGGRYMLVAARPGFVPAMGAPFKTSDTGTTEAPDLVLREGVEVTVRVETDEGHPAGDARVSAWVQPSEMMPPGVGMGAEGRPEVRTDERGIARLGGLSGGTLQLTASRRGHGSVTSALELDLDSPPREAIVMRLTVAATIRGRVLDEAGKPVADRVVMVEAREDEGSTGMPPRLPSPWDAPGGAITDADGRFELADLPGAGRYRLRVVGPGGVSEAQAVDTDATEIVLHEPGERVSEMDFEAMFQEMQRMREQLGDGEIDEAQLLEVMKRLKQWSGGEGGPGGSER